MKLDGLSEAVGSHAAFRRRQRLQPVGGQGDKVFPPTYPGANKNDPPRHVFEDRRVAGGDKPVRCVLLDSVQSQANRLEGALLDALNAKDIALPHLAVDVEGDEIEPIGRITSLDAPHRVFDAILRDSERGGVAFPKTEEGQRLQKASLRDATAVFELSPTALLFGAWNSTGTGGGLGAKFQRCIVSEVVGYGAEEGRRTFTRQDPIGASSAVAVSYPDKQAQDWSHSAQAKKGEKLGKPSDVNHGNIIDKFKGTEEKDEDGNVKLRAGMPLGVTFDYAEQCAVITLAGLRHLRFGDRDPGPARTYLAALGLYALKRLDLAGYALRSRCDLVVDEEDGPAPIELVRSDGQREMVELDLSAAKALYDEALAAAREAGFALDPDPLLLAPQAKLLELVRRSQELALKGQGTDAKGD